MEYFITTKDETHALSSKMNIGPLIAKKMEIIDIKVVLVGVEKIFFKKIVFQFSVVGTIKDENYFSRKIIFPLMEKNNFHFEKI